ncbi:MAG: hypothetical protein ACTHU0_33230 [Kofleriaceae bacterium]
MGNFLAIALTLPLAACLVGSEADDPGFEHDPPGVPPGTPTAASITADETWSGSKAFAVRTTIETGVTVTVAAGTTLSFANGTGLVVKGTLKIEGTSAAKVQLMPDAGASLWDGITVEGEPTAGTLTMSYGVQKGGAISTRAGSTTTITDSKLWGAGGDFLVMTGGTVTMSYSQLGADPGEADTTHCNIHTSGAANTIHITRSNIQGVPYGLMLYGGQNTVFTNNNWFGNEIDVDTSAGVTGDFSGGYFDGAPPVAVGGARLTLDNLSPTKLTDAGIRP